MTKTITGKEAMKIKTTVSVLLKENARIIRDVYKLIGRIDVDTFKLNWHDLLQ